MRGGGSAVVGSLGTMLILGGDKDGNCNVDGR